MQDSLMSGIFLIFYRNENKKTTPVKLPISVLIKNNAVA